MNSQITDDGVFILRGMRTLDNLNLSATGITDRALRAFHSPADFSKLTVLYLHRTKVTKAAVDQLIKARNSKNFRVYY